MVRGGLRARRRIVRSNRRFRFVQSGLPFVAFATFCSNASYPSKIGTEANEGNKVMQRGTSLPNRRVASAGLRSPAPPATSN